MQTSHQPSPPPTNRTLLLLLVAALLAGGLTAADDKPQKITLEKINGRTWLVDAKGKPFFAHGITHVSNNRAEFDYAKISAACKELGFNAYGCPAELQADKHIAGQMIRSGTSPAPNYGEAQSAESKADFVHKMNVCLKELRETMIWLKVIIKKPLCPPDRLAPLIKENDELISIFVKSIQTAQSKKDD